MKLRIVGYLLYLAALAAIVAAIFLTGCGGTPDLPPCGPGTYEFRGICLPTETEPPCGPGTHQLSDICVADNENKCGAGTHWDPEVCEGYGACGKCIADSTPPAKTLVCGPGTLEIAGKCIPDKVPPVKNYVECWEDWDGDSYPSYHNPGGYWAGEGDFCPTGFVKRTDKEDCDDSNLNVHPGAIEICDGKDNNCDGQVDEADPNAGTICIKNPLLSKESVPHWGQLTCQDVGDNKTKKLICAGESICFKTETCGNGVDDDCDGVVDEGCIGTPCKANSECTGGLICSAPTLTTDGKPGGICAIPCKTDADCSAGNACFETYNNGVSGLMVFSCLSTAANLDKNTEFSLASNSPAGATWPGQDQVWHIAKVTAKSFPSQLSQLVYKLECGGCYNPLKPMKQLYTSPTAVGPWKLASTASAALVTGGTATFNAQLTVPASGEIYLAFVGDSTPLSTGDWLTVVLQSVTVSIQYTNPPGTSGPHGALGLPLAGKTLTF